MTVEPARLASMLKHLDARLSHDHLARLAACFTERQVASGEVLVTEGTSPDAAWLIADGRFVVRPRIAGRNVDVARLGPGDMVGEVTLLDGGIATATVAAATPAVVYAISRSAFADLETSDPLGANQLLHAASRTLATRLRAATDRLEVLRTGSAPPTRGGFVDAFRHLFGMGLS